MKDGCKGVMVRLVCLDGCVCEVDAIRYCVSICKPQS